tara:strand:- start:3624 stop:3866 length:243 start_codon:yes stop_codon:yes gene_type:complete
MSIQQDLHKLDMEYIGEELEKAFDAIYEVELYISAILNVDEVCLWDIMLCIADYDEISNGEESDSFNLMLKKIIAKECRG